MRIPQKRYKIRYLFAELLLQRWKPTAGSGTIFWLWQLNLHNLHLGCQIISVFGIWTGNAQGVHFTLIPELAEYIAERDTAINFTGMHWWKGTIQVETRLWEQLCRRRSCSKNPLTKTWENSVHSLGEVPFIPFHLLLLLMCLSLCEDRPRYWLQTGTGLVEWRRGKRALWGVLHCGSRDQAVLYHFSLCWWIGVPALPFSELFFSAVILVLPNCFFFGLWSKEGCFFSSQIVFGSSALLGFLGF